MKSPRTLTALALVAVSSSCGLGSPAEDATPVTAAPPAVSYVAIGGDETMEDDPDSRRDEAWPRILFREHLPPQTVFSDLARPGATVAEALTEQLPVALGLHPTVATIWLESGDVAAGTSEAEYRDGLEELVAALTESGARVVVLMGPSSPARYVDAATAVVLGREAPLLELTETTPSAVAGRVAEQL